MKINKIIALIAAVACAVCAAALCGCGKKNEGEETETEISLTKMTTETTVDPELENLVTAAKTEAASSETETETETDTKTESSETTAAETTSSETSEAETTTEETTVFVKEPAMLYSLGDENAKVGELTFENAYDALRNANADNEAYYTSKSTAFAYEYDGTETINGEEMFSFAFGNDSSEQFVREKYFAVDKNKNIYVLDIATNTYSKM